MDSLRITGARVFDAVDGSLRDTDIYVHNGWIVARPASNASIVDGTGLTLLPGMIDCHTHLTAPGEADIVAQLTGDSTPRATLHAWRAARTHLAAGTTTVRDCGALGGVALELGRAIEDGLVDGARVQACGLVITMTGGHAHFLGREVDGAHEVRKATRQAAKEGAGFIKVMATGGLLTPGVTAGRTAFTPDELRALTEEAHQAGLRVAAHAIGNEGIVNALRAGVDSIEHGFYLDDRAIELLLARDDVFLVPTMLGVHSALACGEEAGIAPWLMRKTEAVAADREESFRRALAAGVRVAAGTDAGTPFNHHGRVAHELAVMVSYGMRPADALIAATRHAAANLGLLDTIGTIEPGKVADLILVDGDPTIDITAVQRVRQVFRSGRPIPAAPW